MDNTHSFLDNIDINIINVDYHHCNQNWNFENVNSPFSRLYLVDDGEAYITHDDKTYTLKKGVVHLIPCFTKHDCHCPDQFNVFFVHFTSMLPQGVDLLSFQNLPFQLKARKETKILFRRLLEINLDKQLKLINPYLPINKSLSKKGDASMYTAGCHLESQGIIRILLSPFLDVPDTSFISSKIQITHQFQDVLKYIEKNISSPISLDELGEVASLESTYLSKRFKKLMGTGLIDYINQKRIEKSQVLLLTTSDNLDTIARHVGFSNWAYFSRVFKNYIGLSPGHYRKQKSRSL